MRRYEFGLEQVLRVRRTQEDVARAVILSANHTVVLRDRQLDVARAHHAARSASNSLSALATPAFLGRRFLEETSASGVAQAGHARDSAVVEAANARASWADAARRVSVLERLDDRRRTEHIREAARQDALEIDDIVVGRYGRAR
jgi:flagellar export protein FliJ